MISRSRQDAAAATPVRPHHQHPAPTSSQLPPRLAASELPRATAPSWPASASRAERASPVRPLAGAGAATSAGAAGRSGDSASVVGRVLSVNSVLIGVRAVGEPTGVAAGQRSSSSGSAEKPLQPVGAAAGGKGRRQRRRHSSAAVRQCLGRLAADPLPALPLCPSHQQAEAALAAVPGCSGRKPAAEALRPCCRSLAVCSFLAAAAAAMREPAPPPQAGMFEPLALAIRSWKDFRGQVDKALSDGGRERRQ